MPVKVFLWLIVIPKAVFASYGMSFGMSSFITGYFWPMPRYTSVRNGRPSACCILGSAVVQIRPPASLLQGPDGLWGDVLGGDDHVGLLLASVRVVDEHEPSLPERLQRLRHAG